MPWKRDEEGGVNIPGFLQEDGVEADTSVREPDTGEIEEANSSAAKVAPHSPRRLRIPVLIGDSEIGLGDAVKRVTSAVGIRPCRSCRKRATALNRWLVLTGRKERRR